MDAYISSTDKQNHYAGPTKKKPKLSSNPPTKKKAKKPALLLPGRTSSEPQTNNKVALSPEQHGVTVCMTDAQESSKSLLPFFKRRDL